MGSAQGGGSRAWREGPQLVHVLFPSEIPLANVAPDPDLVLATVENQKSTLRGGPWTQRFKQIFDKAGMSMENPANKTKSPGLSKRPGH